MLSQIPGGRYNFCFEHQPEAAPRLPGMRVDTLGPAAAIVTAGRTAAHHVMTSPSGTPTHKQGRAAAAQTSHGGAQSSRTPWHTQILHCCLPASRMLEMEPRALAREQSPNTLFSRPYFVCRHAVLNSFCSTALLRHLWWYFSACQFGFASEAVRSYDCGHAGDRCWQACLHPGKDSSQLQSQSLASVRVAKSTASIRFHCAELPSLPHLALPMNECSGRLSRRGSLGMRVLYRSPPLAPVSTIIVVRKLCALVTRPRRPGSPPRRPGLGLGQESEQDGDRRIVSRNEAARPPR